MRRVWLLVFIVTAILSFAQRSVRDVDILGASGVGVGTVWKIYWDGWEGTLVLRRVGNSYLETTDGKRYTVRYFILKNPQDNVEGMTGPGYTGRTSNLGHRIVFFVDFANTPNNPQDDQRFDGYIFTQTIKAQGSKKAMAGITWWNGIPFGFYATFLSVIIY
ncbi:hypothetical protein [Pseudothermotoga sp.]|uniref:hypothetical protein n=1 Tax=Pseudothermotoga sp. TaxID=2033661 RepID=UPI0031F71E70